MNIIHTNPVIKIHAGTALSDIRQCLSASTTCFGLLVHDNSGEIDCRAMMAMLPVPCAGIAFVNDIRLRPHRRMAAEIGLSRGHGCPCRIFGNPLRARAWLEQNLYR